MSCDITIDFVEDVVEVDFQGAIVSINGLLAVAHDDTLSGDGTVGSPLSVTLKSFQDLVTIDGTHVSTKAINLTHTPKYPESLILKISGSGDQIVGVDYNISGSSIIWSGLGLDGIIAVGDQVQISYLIV